MPKTARKPPAALKPRTTSFKLGAEAERFIDAEVKRGAFPNASALVRAALNEYRVKSERRRAFRAALQAGLNSPVDPRDGEEVWDDLEAEFEQTE
jgi:putative addiction module CopG family antidote